MKVYVVERIGDFDNYRCFGLYSNLESANDRFMEVVKELPVVVQYLPTDNCGMLRYAEIKNALYQIACRAVED